MPKSVENDINNFSVIIPTLNRSESLSDTLNSIMQQSLLPRVIYVIDQSNDELTYKVCTGFTLVEYRHSLIKSATNARNIGIKASEEREVFFWVFLDDDVELLPDYFRNMAATYSNFSEVIGVTGWTITPSQKPWGIISNFLRTIGCFDHYSNTMRVLPNFLATSLKRCPKETCFIEWMPGCSMSARNLIHNNEYFDENLILYALGEDRDYSYRLSKKGKMILDPSIELLHKVTPSGRMLTHKKIFMTTVHQYYLMKKHFSNSLIADVAYWWNMLLRYLIGFAVIIFGCFSSNNELKNLGTSICKSVCYVYNNRSRIKLGNLSLIHKFLEK